MGAPVTGHGANIILILGKEQDKQEKEIVGNGAAAGKGALLEFYRHASLHCAMCQSASKAAF